ncbi:MAG: hypothetical protein JWM98_1920, partial [Thermoleophilia bacterium]|nr:hypothetical protein [Thermoleophilia bacterium]
RVTFRDLPVGEYDVRASVSGSGRPWKSKSVPSTGKVSVEAGLQSRAVLVFRPAAKGSASIPIRSTDFTIPWQSREWQGWVTVDKNGNTNTQAGKAQICLVPSPQGRLVGEDIPCEDFDLREGMPSFEFKDVEPGLYSAEILVPPNSYLPLSGTGGYLWVRDNGGVVTHPSNGANTTFEYVKGNCAENVRNSIQGVTPPAPYEDWVWQPCNSPGGGSSAGGSGGGGGQ